MRGSCTNKGAQFSKVLLEDIPTKPFIITNSDVNANIPYKSVKHKVGVSFAVEYTMYT